MKTLHLTSSTNPRVKALARLRRQRDRRETGLFIAEGVREVSRADEVGLKMLELYWCESMIRDSDAERLVERLVADRSTGQLITVTESLMSKLAYRQQPEGVLAVFEQPRWNLDDFINDQSDTPDLWLVTVGTQKPGNLGAMARSADAAGCNGLIVCNGVVDAFNPNAIRASTGAIFRLPVVAASMDELISHFRRRRVRVFTASPRAGLMYDAADFTGPTAMVVGPEDTGFTNEWLTAVDEESIIEEVCIPMRSRTVDSLNAAVAAAVLLFEAVRQRRNAVSSQSSTTK